VLVLLSLTRAKQADKRGRGKMFDAKAINAGVNLVDLVGQSVTLRHVSGEEYAGPCPKCGGTDRFHVTRAWAFCRQCWPLGEGLPHDAIGFVRWRDNSAFSEACGTLGGDKSALQAPGLGPSPRTRPPAAPLPTAAAPGDLWQAKARAFVAWAQQNLWEKEPQALDYLVSRGLSLETIKAAGLGYNPTDYTGKHARKPEDWGLDPAKYKAGVIIHRGWVIPCETGGTLAYVKVRRPQEDIDAAKAWNAAHPGAEYPKSEAKYLCISGSAKLGAIYGLDHVAGAFDLILCEGEINALTLRQELAGVAAVVSVGDAGNKPTAGALATMATVPRWFLAFDHDKAGTSGAAWWDERSKRIRPLPWAWAAKGDKYDVNDAKRDGEDLPAWAIPHLGPSPEDTDKRRAWARYWLDKLIDVPTDPSGPVARSFVAILGEYEALGPDYGPEDVWQPADGPQGGGDLRQGGGDPATMAAFEELTGGGDPQGAELVCSETGEDGPPWPEDLDGWQEIAAPEWSPEDLTGGRKWFQCGDRIISRT